MTQRATAARRTQTAAARSACRAGGAVCLSPGSQVSLSTSLLNLEPSYNWRVDSDSCRSPPGSRRRSWWRWQQPEWRVRDIQRVQQDVRHGGEQPRPRDLREGSSSPLSHPNHGGQAGQVPEEGHQATHLHGPRLHSTAHQTVSLLLNNGTRQNERFKVNDHLIFKTSKTFQKFSILSADFYNSFIHSFVYSFIHQFIPVGAVSARLAPGWSPWGWDVRPTCAGTVASPHTSSATPGSTLTARGPRWTGWSCKLTLVHTISHLPKKEWKCGNFNNFLCIWLMEISTFYYLTFNPSIIFLFFNAAFIDIEVKINL